MSNIYVLEEPRKEPKKEGGIDAEGNKIQLLHGNCLELMKEISDKSIDMILCDLPYGQTCCDWDIPIDMESLWNQYKRIIKDHGAILLFSTQPFTTDLICSNRRMFRYEIIWEKTQKTGFYNANKMPLKGHENILVFYKKIPTYHPIKRKISELEAKIRGVNIGKTRQKKADRCVLYGHIDAQDYTDDGTRYPHDVIHFSNWNGALFGNLNKVTKHPTQKPIPLLEYLIKTYTNEGDIVLDNCMGSGSTGVACVNLNRDFIGMELKQEYFNIAKERIHKAQTEPKQITFEIKEQEHDRQ